MSSAPFDFGVPALLAVWFALGAGACALTHWILRRWPGTVRVFFTMCAGPFGYLGTALAVIQRRLGER